MNEEDFRSATVDMEDTALWDIRRIALLATRRDGATPVRYFEDAVTEALRSLHRLSLESLWDELQKHDLGKRTLRVLAAEYKPARMVAFEPDDLKKASVRFWEALRTEDEAVREALAAYNYGAVSEQLAALSGTIKREVVSRLVYINCPRQNVVEEVVGTVVGCTINELKMLASKLYDRLDKTSSLSPENRDIAKKLQQCKTKEELRAAVRDLLQMFKRKQHPGDSNIIGPSIATVTVSYKGHKRQVAAVVRIERLDKVDAPHTPSGPTPPPEPAAAYTAQEPYGKAGGGRRSAGGNLPDTKAESVIMVCSDRTIPPSPPNHGRVPERVLGGGGGGLSSAVPSKAPSKATSVVTGDRNKGRDTPPPGSVLGGGGGRDALLPLRSPSGTTPAGSVLAGGGGGKEASGLTLRATPPGSVLNGSEVNPGPVSELRAASSVSSFSSTHTVEQRKADPLDTINDSGDPQRSPSPSSSSSSASSAQRGADPLDRIPSRARARANSVACSQ